MVDDLPVPREECLRCWKPRVTCVCDDLPVLPNRTAVQVIQHPKERGHPLGTARFVELGLERSAVHVAHGLDASRVIASLDGPAALLFPGEGAVAPDALPVSPRTLVVLDGTWATVRTLLRENPALRELPRVTLPEHATSRYRIRREPCEGYVSTLEAVLAVLARLEPELPDPAPLLGAFDRMIDRQIEAERRNPVRRRRQRGARPFVGVPRGLGEHFRDATVVYADFSRRGSDGNRRLLRLVAERLADGARLDLRVGDPPTVEEAPPDAPELRASGASVTLDEAERRLAAFVPERGVLVAWNGALAARLGGRLGRASLDLAAAYRARFGRGDGVLERVVERHGLPAGDSHFAGRAGPRLANAVTLCRFLHDDAALRGRRTG